MVNIWWALFWFWTGAAAVIWLIIACLVLRGRVLRRRHRPGTLRMLQAYESTEAVSDAVDAAFGSHRRHRGIAAAAPEGLGPRILRRQPSNVIPPRAYFDRSARRAIDEVLAQMGER